MNATRWQISDEIQVMQQEYSRERDIAYMFAMDALELGHYDTLCAINKIADQAHSKAIAAIEIASAVRRGLAK